jgi:hypothetical protein
MTEKPIEPDSKEVQTIAKGAMQRHHDYFVGLKEMGKLPEEDFSNYQLAMEREGQGLVEPLVVQETDVPNPLKEEEEE